MVDSKVIGIDQLLDSIPAPIPELELKDFESEGIGVELELKDFESEGIGVELELKDFESEGIGVELELKDF